MKRSTRFTRQWKWKKFDDLLAETKITLSWLTNSNMVKAEKFDHLHQVYHFIVPLKKALNHELILKKSLQSD